MNVSANDVAQYILNKCGSMTSMKLHKLLYYCQAWSLVWDDKPLYHERIEAWINGPVIPAIFDQHKGIYQIDNWSNGNIENMDSNQKDTIDNVLSHYGDKTSQWLITLTHNEDPWINARKGLLPNERGNNEITLAQMFEYYQKLYEDSGNE